MKKIFKEAHKMTREMVEKYGVDYQAQFGLCLSYLLENKEGEEVKELKGTEKQVKWAEDIRARQMEEYNGFKERWIEKRKAEENNEELDYIEELTRKIESIDSASKWIDIHQAGITLHQLLVPKRRKEVLERMRVFDISL